MALLLGYDVGSSSIKATLMDAQTGEAIASATSPSRELEIMAPKSGWAEQHPATWWEHVKKTTAMIKDQSAFDPFDIKAIGISYQMHGLVAVDGSGNVLRPSIIWCDSRAVQIGNQAAADIGQKKCLETMLNLPGNFTASKLKWVKDNEPEIYSQIHKIMLPGDYIAMKMTDGIATTESGLSEGIIWNYQSNRLADVVLDNYGINADLIPETVPTFGQQGQLSAEAAKELGLATGTKLTYRGGDQPNNALSLGVLEPGQIAVTAGTSGVVYGVTDKANFDDKSRVNVFVHVNHSPETPRYGVLLCVNGTGILNSWLKHNFVTTDSSTLTYEQMNDLAAQAPIGSEGLVILPYGNGAERTLENRNIGASTHSLNFNIHKKAHFLRAAQEGIVFALNFGLDIMQNMGIELTTAKAGNANMFLSPLFAQAFATVTNTTVELYNTDGSQGAARGAGIGAGIYSSTEDAFAGLNCQKVVEPQPDMQSPYKDAYKEWLEVLKAQLEHKA